MRLFHVSEEPDIKEFIPRVSERLKGEKVVWAICEETLPNFLLPRNCPRVAYHCLPNSLQSDIDAYFSTNERYVVAVESAWFSSITGTTLYVYEFDVKGFYLQDKIAGYYISDTVPEIIGKTVVNNPLKELLDRNVEVRFLPNLWVLAKKIENSSLAWSLCRMAYAQKPLCQ